jgi:SAM-dependent methyltransferase
LSGDADSVGGAAPVRERYSGGYGPRLLRGLSRRSLTREGAFFLPHLRPGMRVLDCGCGPGAMTVDLAAAVAPGEVVGLDLEADQFAVGRDLARERGLANVRFEQGSVYRLPFPDAFDAVFAHAVLYHLADPGAALREIHRVLRPGGVVGIRDTDVGGDLYAPSDPLLDRAWDLLDRLVRHSGGNPRFGRVQRAALREAGFGEVVATASFDAYGTPEATQGWAAFWAEYLTHQHAELVVAQGWATRADLDRIERAFRAWGTHPDAFAARARCEAVGRKATDPGARGDVDAPVAGAG